ncbi:unnamed protein product [Natator depressus]
MIIRASGEGQNLPPSLSLTVSDPCRSWLPGSCHVTAQGSSEAQVSGHPELESRTSTALPTPGTFHKTSLPPPHFSCPGAIDTDSQHQFNSSVTAPCWNGCNWLASMGMDQTRVIHL